MASIPTSAGAGAYAPRAQGAAERLFETAHLERDLGRRAVRGGATTVLAQGLKFVLTTGATAVLARLLAPDDFGLVAMVAAVMGLLGLLKDPGFSTATVQRAELRHEQVSTLFWVHAGLAGAIMLVGALLAPVLSWAYGKPQLLWVGVALAVDAGLMGLAIQHLALLQRNMRFGVLAGQDLAARCVGIGAGIWVALAGGEYWALVAMQVTTSAVSVGLLWALCRWRPGPPVRGAGVRQMMVFGGNVSGGWMLGYAAQAAMTVLLGYALGSEPLGHFTRAYGLMLLPLWQLLPPIQTVAVPTLARLAGDPERQRRAFLGLVEMGAMGAAALSAVLIVTADWLVQLLLGSQWGEAARLAAMLGICAFAQPVVTVMTWAFIVHGRDRAFLAWGIVKFALTVTATAGGLPWGVQGVAAALAAESLLVEVPVCLVLTGRVAGVPARALWGRVAPYAMCGLVVVLAGLWVRGRVAAMPAAVGLTAFAGAMVAGYVGILMSQGFGRRAIGAVVRQGRAGI